MARASQGPGDPGEPGDARIQELYGKLGYDLRFLRAPRRISCYGDRTTAQQILATRNL